VVHFIEGGDIGTVWIQGIKLVLLHGKTVEDDQGLLRELSPLYLHFDNPSEDDPIINRFGDKDVLSFMQQNFERSDPIPSWGYSYAQRLRGNNRSSPLAQIQERLQAYPTTKSATLSLLRPEEDTRHTPCLTTLDFKIRDTALCLHAFFRSQDVGKKMYADALQLLRIGQSLKESLPVDKIHLHLTLCSAHLYERDFSILETLVNRTQG